MYTETFVEIYNWHNCGLVHETHGMVELQKYLISKIKNFLNLITYQFYKIFSILRSTYVMPRDNEVNTFYINNYID